MIDVFFDELVWSYAETRDRVERMPNEMMMFTAFFHEFMEQFADDTPKYLHMKTLGLALIKQNQSIFYRKIREAVRSVHLRSKNNSRISRSKAPRSGRGRTRRLV